jgi:DNA-binding MarR family transcriptional regulator
MATSEETARDLLGVLPLINRIMAAELRQEAGEDTTMPQFRVLTYLSEQPLTLSEIARRRRVSLQSAGDLIQTLVERGWIQRVPDPSDRRQVLLHLTDEGKQKYQRANERMLIHLIPFMDMLTDEETAAVRVALHALQRVFSGQEALETESDDTRR